MREHQIREIIANISYKDWKIHFWCNPNYTIQLTWTDKCVVSGEVMEQESRCWALDNPHSEDDVVNTVFKAIQNAEEHETKEKFIYLGKRVFNPHTKIAKLLEICDSV